MNKNTIPPTTKRVAYHTNNNINNQIRDNTINKINSCKKYDNLIFSKKIDQLDREWDTERLLEANAASMVLLSSIFGYQKNKCSWFLFSGTIGFFLLQHAILGWCPPLPIIRKVGIRTAEEINNEKTVYKKLRGDFSQDTDDGVTLLEMTEK